MISSAGFPNLLMRKNQHDPACGKHVPHVEIHEANEVFVNVRDLRKLRRLDEVSSAQAVSGQRFHRPRSMPSENPIHPACLGPDLCLSTKGNAWHENLVRCLPHLTASSHPDLVQPSSTLLMHQKAPDIARPGIFFDDQARMWPRRMQNPTKHDPISNWF